MELLKWTKDQCDRTVAVMAMVAGIVFLILGWVGASGKSLTTEQIPYLASGAVAGLFALGVAATLWLSADLRDEWRKLDEIHTWMQSEAATREPYAPPADEGKAQLATGEPTNGGGRRSPQSADPLPAPGR